MSRFVPINMGAPESLELEVGGFQVTNALFAPHDFLAPHIHERASLAVMLRGSFELHISGKTHECLPGTAFTEPAGERHDNRMQKAGAEVLVVQPNLQFSERLGLDRRLIEDVQYMPGSAAIGAARQLALELRRRDEVTPLAVEGLVLELLAHMVRDLKNERTGGSSPKWLSHVEDILQAHFRDRLRVHSIAREVGVHPVHMARVFRARHGMSVGAFVRMLRLQWAANQIVHSEETLASIATRAGFSDQSHFTRLFSSTMGLTPARYRQQHAKH